MNNTDNEKNKSFSIPVLLLRQSDGKPSASFTMVFLAFNVCLLWLFLSIVEGLGPVKVRSFDSGQAMAFLTPLLGLYFGRRFTDSKNSSPE
jgi:hypothetical protein